jgi:hypothetical protein
MAAKGTNLAYAPLDKKQEQIRIVNLAPGNPTDAISASLSTVSLLENPSFEALSYVWGNASVKVPITLDLHVVTLTVNLEAALRRMRLRDVPRRIWADAICIYSHRTTMKYLRIWRFPPQILRAFIPVN